MNKKAVELRKALDILHLAGFEEHVIDDEFQTVIFCSNMEINGHLLPITIHTSNAIYVIFRVLIVQQAVTKGTEKIILEYLNELNAQYRMFKYYTNEQGDFMLECCINLAVKEALQPAFIMDVMNMLVEHLSGEYGTIMKKIWAHSRFDKQRTKIE